MDPASPVTPSEFWATVAQVIPVLALALVLELRVLAKRWGKKRVFKRQKERRRWAVAAIVLTLSMVTVETNAISQLWYPTTDRILSMVSFIVAQTVIGATLLLVVSIPVMSIAVPAVADALSGPVLRRSLRKRRKEARQELRKIAMIAVQSESDNLEAMMKVAQWRRLRCRYNSANDADRARFLAQNEISIGKFDEVEAWIEVEKKNP